MLRPLLRPARDVDPQRSAAQGPPANQPRCGGSRSCLSLVLCRSFPRKRVELNSLDWKYQIRTMPPVFRFAPSPNGYLHLGHALSALLNAEKAHVKGGRLLLRIEDIDTARCRPEYEAAIYEDLAWLGLRWEMPARRQSEHYEDYRDALAKLEAIGLIYPSFETRAEIARMVAARDAEGACPRDPDG